MHRVALFVLGLSGCVYNQTTELDAAVDAERRDSGIDAPLDGAVVDAAIVDGADLDAPALDGAPADADDDAGPPVDADGDAATCTATETGFPLAAGVHVELCSQVTYATNPPTSGLHYPTWAKYKTYGARVGRPFWVHDLEHGAIVVTYNCPAGCDAELAQLATFLAARPADPLCSAAVRNRFVVTPDPELDVKFAASAWGFALEGDCLDLPALGRFIDAHYAHGPENLCGDGVDVLDPGAGFPPNCP